MPLIPVLQSQANLGEFEPSLVYKQVPEQPRLHSETLVQKLKPTKQLIKNSLTS